MAGRSKSRVALGFAPHSGWAVVIGLSAEPHARVVIRERVEMADPRDAASKQPYHAVEGAPIDAAARRLLAYADTAERMAGDAIQGIASRLARDGHDVVGVGILESAGRKGGSLADILRSHALIHTADGDHFRSALAAAATRCGLGVSRVRARDLEAEAAAVIGKGVQTLHNAVKELGRKMGPPWGADQKAAALLAWLVLARR